jgi:predicted small lipoprotein YifL
MAVKLIAIALALTLTLTACGVKRPLVKPSEIPAPAQDEKAAQ